VTFSADQTDELWSRWRRGEPSRLIPRSLGCHATKVRRLLAASAACDRRPDGVGNDTCRGRSESRCRGRSLPRGPHGRSRLGWAGLGWAGLGWAGLGRSASTVSREIARNGGREAYRAQTADLAAGPSTEDDPARRRSVLRGLVQAKLGDDWSPQRITVWLRRTHPGDTSRRLSHETIYRTIFHAARPELGARPWQRLRSGRSVRHPRAARRKGHGRGRLRTWCPSGTGPPR